MDSEELEKAVARGVEKGTRDAIAAVIGAAIVFLLMYLYGPAVFGALGFVLELALGLILTGGGALVGLIAAHSFALFASIGGVLLVASVIVVGMAIGSAAIGAFKGLGFVRAAAVMLFISCSLAAAYMVSHVMPSPAPEPSPQHASGRPAPPTDVDVIVDGILAGPKGAAGRH